MKHLNDKATAIFRKLTEGMDKVGDHQQWNNDSSFMAACIEIIGRTGLGPLVSIAHYYQQNGDMMRDPDVVFVIGADQHVYPISYQTGQHGHLPGSCRRRGWKVEGAAENAIGHLQLLQPVDAKHQRATTTGSEMLVPKNESHVCSRCCCPRQTASDHAATRKADTAKGRH